MRKRFFLVLLGCFMLFLSVGCKKEEEPPKRPPVELPADGNNEWTFQEYFLNFDFTESIFDLDNVSIDISYGTFRTEIYSEAIKDNIYIDEAMSQLAILEGENTLIDIDSISVKELIGKKEINRTCKIPKNFFEADSKGSISIVWYISVNEDGTNKPLQSMHYENLYYQLQEDNKVKLSK